MTQFDGPIRAAQHDDIVALAELWHSGWIDAHKAIVPEALARIRTRTRFLERIAKDQAQFRVAGPIGAPLGMHLTKAEELSQLFVSAAARGTGLAHALVQDAEQKIRDNGASKAWLACAIGNERAARFYTKCGWQLVRDEEVLLDGSDPPFALTTWIFEKEL